MRNHAGNFLMAAALAVALSGQAEAQIARPRYADGDYTATGIRRRANMAGNPLTLPSG
jgi:hypothetical protein